MIGTRADYGASIGSYCAWNLAIFAKVSAHFEIRSKPFLRILQKLKFWWNFSDFMTLDNRSGEWVVLLKRSPINNKTSYIVIQLIDSRCQSQCWPSSDKMAFLVSTRYPSSCDSSVTTSFTMLPYVYHRYGQLNNTVIHSSVLLCIVEFHWTAKSTKIPKRQRAISLQMKWEHGQWMHGHNYWVFPKWITGSFLNLNQTYVARVQGKHEST